MEKDIKNEAEQEKKPEVTISDFSRLLSELSEEGLDKLLFLCLL